MSSHPIPPAPSFAEFKFNTIGQQPVLLKRFSAPDQTLQSSPSPSPSPAQQKPDLLSDAIRTPISLSRPTLLQALANQTPPAQDPPLTMETNSMVVDDSVSRVVGDVLPPRNGPHQTTSAPSARVIHDFNSPSQAGDVEPLGSASVGAENFTDEHTHQNPNQGHVAPEPIANTVHAPRPRLPSNGHGFHLSQFLADDTTLVEPPTLLYPQSVEPTTPPAPWLQAAGFSLAALRRMQSRLLLALENMSPPSTRTALRQVQSANNHSATALAAAHRAVALAQQCSTTAQEAVTAANESLTSAEKSRTCINDALGSVEEISFGNGGENSKEWEYKQRIAEMKGDLRMIGDWMAERETRESRAKIKKEKKKKASKAKRSRPDVHEIPLTSTHEPDVNGERTIGAQSPQAASSKEVDVQMSDESSRMESSTHADNSSLTDNHTPRNDGSVKQQSNMGSTLQPPITTSTVPRPQDAGFSQRSVSTARTELQGKADEELKKRLSEEQQVEAAAAKEIREELEKQKEREQVMLDRERDAALARQRANDESIKRLADKQREEAMAKAKEDVQRENERLEREKVSAEQEAIKKREAETARAAAQAESQRQVDEAIARSEEQERKRQEISQGKRRAKAEETNRILAERSQDKQAVPNHATLPSTQQPESQASVPPAVPFGNLVARSTLLNSTPVRAKTNSPGKKQVPPRALSRAPAVPSSTQNHEVSVPLPRGISLPPIVHIPARESPVIALANTPSVSVFRQSRDLGNMPVVSRPHLPESAQHEQAINLRFLMDATGIPLEPHINVKQEIKEDDQLLRGQENSSQFFVHGPQEPTQPIPPAGHVQRSTPLPTAQIPRPESNHAAELAQQRTTPTRPRYTNEETAVSRSAGSYFNQSQPLNDTEATRQSVDSRISGANERVNPTQPSNPYPRADRFSPSPPSPGYPTTGQKRYRDYEDSSQLPPAHRPREAMDRPRARRTPSPPPRHSSWYARRSPTPERLPLADRLGPQDYTRRVSRGDSYRPSYSSFIERRSPSPISAPPPRRRNPVLQARPELLDRFNDPPPEAMNIQPPSAPRSQVRGNSRGPVSTIPLEQRLSFKPKPLMSRIDEGVLR
ncbi:hypothetical protein BD779DRAFT_1506535 [Infundibulicybe gibba]|nr:hypothetical protein BD779DRAFT_1506535 [Infundibulicybe gibba]